MESEKIGRNDQVNLELRKKNIVNRIEKNKDRMKKVSVFKSYSPSEQRMVVKIWGDDELYNQQLKEIVVLQKLYDKTRRDKSILLEEKLAQVKNIRKQIAEKRDLIGLVLQDKLMVGEEMIIEDSGQRFWENKLLSVRQIQVLKSIFPEMGLSEIPQLFMSLRSVNKVTSENIIKGVIDQRLVRYLPIKKDDDGEWEKADKLWIFLNVFRDNFALEMRESIFDYLSDIKGKTVFDQKKIYEVIMPAGQRPHLKSLIKNTENGKSLEINEGDAELVFRKSGDRQNFAIPSQLMGYIIEKSEKFTEDYKKAISRLRKIDNKQVLRNEIKNNLAGKLMIDYLRKSPRYIVGDDLRSAIIQIIQEVENHEILLEKSLKDKNNLILSDLVEQIKENNLKIESMIIDYCIDCGVYKKEKDVENRFDIVGAVRDWHKDKLTSVIAKRWYMWEKEGSTDQEKNNKLSQLMKFGAADLKVNFRCKLKKLVPNDYNVTNKKKVAKTKDNPDSKDGYEKLSKKEKNTQVLEEILSKKKKGSSDLIWNVDLEGGVETKMCPVGWGVKKGPNERPLSPAQKLIFAMEDARRNIGQPWSDELCQKYIEVWRKEGSFYIGHGAGLYFLLNYPKKRLFNGEQIKVLSLASGPHEELITWHRFLKKFPNIGMKMPMITNLDVSPSMLEKSRNMAETGLDFGKYSIDIIGDARKFDLSEKEFDMIECSSWDDIAENDKNENETVKKIWLQMLGHLKVKGVIRLQVYKKYSSEFIEALRSLGIDVLKCNDQYLMEDKQAQKKLNRMKRVRFIGIKNREISVKEFEEVMSKVNVYKQYSKLEELDMLIYGAKKKGLTVELNNLRLTALYLAAKKLNNGEFDKAKRFFALAQSTKVNNDGIEEVDEEEEQIEKEESIEIGFDLATLCELWDEWLLKADELMPIRGEEETSESFEKRKKEFMDNFHKVWLNVSDGLMDESRLKKMLSLLKINSELLSDLWPDVLEKVAKSYNLANYLDWEMYFKVADPVWKERIFATMIAYPKKFLSNVLLGNAQNDFKIKYINSLKYDNQDTINEIGTYSRILADCGQCNDFWLKELLSRLPMGTKLDLPRVFQNTSMMDWYYKFSSETMDLFDKVLIKWQRSNDDARLLLLPEVLDLMSGSQDCSSKFRKMLDKIEKFVKKAPESHRQKIGDNIVVLCGLLDKRDELYKKEVVECIENILNENETFSDAQITEKIITKFDRLSIDQPEFMVWLVENMHKKAIGNSKISQLIYIYVNSATNKRISNDGIEDGFREVLIQGKVVEEVKTDKDKKVELVNLVKMVDENKRFLNEPEVIRVLLNHNIDNFRYRIKEIIQNRPYLKNLIFRKGLIGTRAGVNLLMELDDKYLIEIAQYRPEMLNIDEILVHCWRRCNEKLNQIIIKHYSGQREKELLFKLSNSGDLQAICDSFELLRSSKSLVNGQKRKMWFAMTRDLRRDVLGVIQNQFPVIEFSCSDENGKLDRNCDELKKYIESSQIVPLDEFSWNGDYLIFGRDNLNRKILFRIEDFQNLEAENIWNLDSRIKKYFGLKLSEKVREKKENEYYAELVAIKFSPERIICLDEPGVQVHAPIRGFIPKSLLNNDALRYLAGKNLTEDNLGDLVICGKTKQDRWKLKQANE